MVFDKVHCLNECYKTMGKQKRIEDNKGFARSVISPTFAKNFIKTYITND